MTYCPCGGNKKETRTTWQRVDKMITNLYKWKRDQFNFPSIKKKKENENRTENESNTQSQNSGVNTFLKASNEFPLCAYAAVKATHIHRKFYFELSNHHIDCANTNQIYILYKTLNNVSRYL